MFVVCSTSTVLAYCWLLLGQITVPEVSEAYDPVFARCEFPVDDKAIVTGTWFSSDGVKVEYRPQTKKVRIGKREFVVVDDSKPSDLRIWAKPGEHTLRIVLSINHIEYRQVFVADESDPTNRDKAQAETLPVLVSSENKEFTQKFRVLAPRPPPKPDEIVPPNPDPPKPEPPNPTPLVKRIKIVVLEDNFNRNPRTAGILNDRAFWDDYLDSKGHSYQIVPENTIEPREVEYVNTIKQVLGMQKFAVGGAYAMFLNGDTGAIVGEPGTLATTETLKKLCEKYSGK